MTGEMCVWCVGGGGGDTERTAGVRSLGRKGGDPRELCRPLDPSVDRLVKLQPHPKQ